MKQTAVEFVFEELENRQNGWPHFTIEQIYNKAKEMEKQNMINFLKSVFRQDGFDYEESYNNFLKNK
jgi:hypothetical protein